MNIEAIRRAKPAHGATVALFVTRVNDPSVRRAFADWSESEIAEFLAFLAWPADDHGEACVVAASFEGRVVTGHEIAWFQERAKTLLPILKHDRALLAGGGGIHKE